MNNQEGYNILCFASDNASELLRKIHHHRAALANFKGNVDDFCYNVNLKNDLTGKHRSFVVFKGVEDLRTKLSNCDFFLGKYQTTNTAMMFAGEGSIWNGCCSYVYKNFSTFQKVFDKCVNDFGKNLDVKNLKNVIMGIDQQPYQYPLVTLFSIQYALVKLWEDLGITSDVILTHSDGEYCGALISGILTYSNAIDLISIREKLLYSESIRGKMVVIFTNPNDINEALGDSEFSIKKNKNLSFACYNAPNQTVISGDNESIEQLTLELNKRDVKYHVISDLIYPFHSKCMEDIATKICDKISHIQHEESKKIYVGSTYGKEMKILNKTYWKNQIIEPVQFVKVMKHFESVYKDKYTFVLEIGPSNTLKRLSKKILNEKNMKKFNLECSIDKKNVEMNFFTVLGKAFVSGMNINWNSLYKDKYHKEVMIQPLLKEKDSYKGGYEKIAIIGMSCRLPDGIESPKMMWKRLVSKKDAITEIPDNGRFNLENFEKAEYKAPMKGGFIKGAYMFDRKFFKMKRRETELMDPQIRITLECVVEALENAGIPLDSLKTSHRIGIIIGRTLNDFSHQITSIDEDSPWSVTGNTSSGAAGFISMVLEVEGPCYTIDSACSSSITSIHTGIQYLQSHQVDTMIVGSQNIVLMESMNIALTNARMLSPRAKSSVFDESADGYARSDGVVVMILKRLSDAKKEGDKIHGVIRGSCVRTAGKRALVTIPKSSSQSKLMSQVLKVSGLTPNDIDYLESHGTGTALGDPVECRSIRSVFHGNRNRLLEIRSAKACIGHAETTAGFVGLVSVLKGMENKQIPPQINLQKMNPKLKFIKEIPARVSTDVMEWQPRKDDVKRIAMINSFGFSGIDGSMIVEEPPLFKGYENTKGIKTFVVPLSAKTLPALNDLKEKYMSYLGEENEKSFESISFTSQIGRAHYSKRICVFGKSVKILLEKLKDNQYKFGDVGESTNTGMCFLFTGQGSQYFQVGYELSQHNELFKSFYVTCLSLFSKELSVDMKKMVFDDEINNNSIYKAKYSQAIIFSIQYALINLFKEMKVSPDYVIGHSVGEFAAAFCANIMTLEDCVKLISHRSKCMDELKVDGKMLAIISKEGKIDSFLSQYEDFLKQEKIEIASYNSREQVVVSGRIDNINNLTKKLKDSSFTCKEIRTSHPFHSSYMSKMIPKFKEVADTVKYKQQTIRFISTLRGRELKRGEIDSKYWCDHILQSVKFKDALQITVKDLSCKFFLEIGPHPVLSSLAVQCFERHDVDFKSVKILHPLKRKGSDWITFLSCVSELYCFGIDVEWKVLWNNEFPRKCEIPTYAYQKEFIFPREITANCKLKKRGNPLLGYELNSQILHKKNIFIHSAFLNKLWPVFIEDHKLFDECVLSGTSYISAALSAGKKLYRDKMYAIKNVVFAKPVILTDYRRVNFQTIIQKRSKEEGFDFQMCNLRKTNEWEENCNGSLVSVENILKKELKLGELIKHCKKIVKGEDIRKKAKEHRLDLGNTYSWINKVYVNDGNIIGVFRSAGEVPDGMNTASLSNEYENKPFYILHPGLIDSFFQTCLALYFTTEKEQKLKIPLGVKSFIFNANLGSPKYTFFRVSEDIANTDQINLDIDIFNEEKKQIGEIKQLTLRNVNQEMLLQSIQKENLVNDLLYKVVWERRAINEDLSVIKGSYIVFMNETPFAKKFLTQLNDLGKDLDVKCVFEGKGYEKNGDVFVINPYSENDFQKLFLSFKFMKVKGIVYLWSYKDFSKLTIEDTETEIMPVFYLFKLMAKKKFTNFPRVWTITESVDSVDVMNQPNEMNIFHTPIAGLLRSVSVEIPENQPTHIDFPKVKDKTELIMCLLRELQNNKDDRQVVYQYHSKEGKFIRNLPRLSDMGNNILNFPEDNYYVDKGGDKSEEGPKLLKKISVKELKEEALELSGKEVIVDIKAVSVNFRDVLNSMNMYIGFDRSIGTDFSGVINKIGQEVKQFKIGDKVFGISSKCYGNKVKLSQNMVCKIPSFLNCEDAAQIPVIFYTAYYCLVKIAKIKKGDTVLIHSACGGVGLAAIQICKLYDVEIFATAGKEYKREYLRKLGIKHVMDSHNAEDYGTKVMEVTKGIGVNVILNSLTGKGFIKKNLEICSNDSKFIEIAKREIWVTTEVKRFRLAHKKTINYWVFEMKWNDFFQRRDILDEIMELVKSKKLHPLPALKFGIENTIKSFNYMLSGKHIGKILMIPSNHPGFYATNSYLITGGLGGIGLEYAKYLFHNKGVKHLILVGRSKPNEEKIKKLQALKKEGAIIYVMNADVSKPNDVDILFKNVKKKCPPLRGIFHSAGVLSDGAIKEMEFRSFKKVLLPKVNGSWNLHYYSKLHEMKLDHFVLFSSIVSVYGSPGQTNYTSANFFLDSLVKMRRREGLSGTTINWGGWNLGMIKDTIGVGRLSKIGMTPLSPSTAFSALDVALKTKQSQVVIADIDFNVFVGALPSLRPFFEKLLDEDLGRMKATGLLKKLQSVNLERRRKILGDYLFKLIKSMTSELPPDFDINSSLSKLGIDSFTFEGIRNNVYSSLEGRVNLTLGDLIHFPTILALCNNILKKLLLDKDVIKVLETNEALSATPIQRTFYLLSKLYPNQGVNHIVLTEDIDPSMNLDKLKTSLLSMVNNIDVLRVLFRLNSGNLHVDMENASEITIDIEKIECKEFQMKDSNINSFISKPFDFTKPPLIRIGILYHQNNKKCKLCLVSHKILLDFESLKLIHQKLLSIYKGESISLKEKDEYIIRIMQENNSLQSNESKISFWNNQLKGITAVIPLEFDIQRKRKTEFDSSLYFHKFSSKILKGLNSFCKDMKIKENDLFLIVLFLCLYKEIGISNFTIGCLNKLINNTYVYGNNENIIPITLEMLKEHSFQDVMNNLLKKKTKIFKSLKGFKFFNLLYSIDVPIDSSFHPICQILFDWKDTNHIVHELRGISQMDMDFRFFKSKSKGICVNVLYNGRIYKSKRIKRLISSYENIMKYIITNGKKNEKISKYLKFKSFIKKYKKFGQYYLDIHWLHNHLRTHKMVKDVHLYFHQKDKLIAYIEKHRKKTNAYKINEVLDYIENNLENSQIPKDIMVPLFADMKRMFKVLNVKTLSGLKRLMDLANIEGSKTFQNKLFGKLLSGTGLKKTLKKNVKNMVIKSLTKEIKSELANEIIQFVPNDFFESTLIEFSQKIEVFFYQIRDKKILDELEYLLNYVPLYYTPNEFIMLNKITTKKDGSIDFSKLPKSNLHDDEAAISKTLIDLVGGKQRGISKEEKIDNSKKEISESTVFGMFEQAYTSPNTLLMESFCQICSNILERNVKVNENIFVMNNISFTLKFIYEIEKKDIKGISLYQLYKYRNLKNLIDYIESNKGNKEEKVDFIKSDPILTIQKGKKGVCPLILIHPATGLSFSYMSLRGVISKDIPIYGINNPFFGTKEENYKSIKDMAKDYVPYIKQINPTGPYVLGGWSFGGNVCLDIACLLRNDNQVVKNILLFDSFNYSVYSLSENNFRINEFFLFAQILNIAGSEVVRQELMHNLVLSAVHKPIIYPGRVTLIKSNIVVSPFDIVAKDPYHGFQKMIPNGFCVREVEGSHFQLFFGDNVENTARVIESVLDDSKMNDYVIYKMNVERDVRLLLYACINKDEHLMNVMTKWIIQQGKQKDLNSIDFQGRSVIHYACLYGNRKLVEMLLKNGVNKNTKDLNGASPFKLAELNGFKEIEEYVLTFKSIKK